MQIEQFSKSRNYGIITFIKFFSIQSHIFDIELNVDFGGKKEWKCRNLETSLFDVK